MGLHITPAFVGLSFHSRVISNPRHSAHRSTRVNYARTQAQRLKAALVSPEVPAFWDETAPSMLTFAASGPGWIALGMALAVAAICISNFFEIGPRRQKPSPLTYLVHVQTPKPISFELPSGIVIHLRQEHSMFRETAPEAVDAAVRNMEMAAVKAGINLSYQVYKATDNALAFVRAHPPPVQAKDIHGWQEIDVPDPGNDKNVIWEEYAMLNSHGPVEKEWVNVLRGLGGIVRGKGTIENSCKLCGGKGLLKCHRCMGASATGAIACAHCSNGLVPCTWCGNQY